MRTGSVFFYKWISGTRYTILELGCFLWFLFNLIGFTVLYSLYFLLLLNMFIVMLSLLNWCRCCTYLGLLLIFIHKKIHYASLSTLWIWNCNIYTFYVKVSFRSQCLCSMCSDIMYFTDIWVAFFVWLNQRVLVGCDIPKCSVAFLFCKAVVWCMLIFYCPYEMLHVKTGLMAYASRVAPVQPAQWHSLVRRYHVHWWDPSIFSYL